MSEIDHNALDNVRALQRPGKPDLLGRIVDLFVTQTPKDVATITASVVSEDFELVRITAHSVKSSAAYVGAHQFSERLAKIEKAACENDLAQCQQLANKLDQHAKAVIDELLTAQDKVA